MASAKMTVRHIANTGKKNTEIFTCDPSKINVNISSETAVAIDTFARAFVNLSTDTYDDTEISQYQSVSEILAE